MDGRDGDETVAGETAGVPRTDGGTDPLDDPVEGQADANDADGEPADAGAEPTGAGEAAPGIPVSRRQAILGAGVVGVLGVGVGASHVLRPAQAVSPEVPRRALEENDWVRVAEATEPVVQDSAGPISIEAIASTVRYENEGLVADIKDRDVTVEFAGDTQTERLGDHAGGQFDQSMGVFAAMKVDITPHIDELPAGIGRAQVMGPVRTQAGDQFESQLREAGLENVREVEPTTTFEPDSGADATFFEYRGAFRFEQTSVDVQGTQLQIPGGSIEIAGYLAVWHDGRNVVVAAGAHPNQNYTDTVTDTVAGRELTIDVDLGLRPSQLREEALGYMAAVE